MHEASSGQCQVPKGMIDASQVHKNFNQGITMLFRCQKGLKILPERWNMCWKVWEQGLEPWEMGQGTQIRGRTWWGWARVLPKSPSWMRLQKVGKKPLFPHLFACPHSLSLAFLPKIAHTHTLAKTWAWWGARVCMNCQFWARRSAGESSHCPPQLDMHVFFYLSLAMVATQGSILIYLT